MISRASVRLCRWCGRGLPSHSQRNRMYCNANCKAAMWKQKHSPSPMDRALKMRELNATCMECGKRYHRKSKKGCYCGVTCRVAAHRREKSE